MWFGIFWVKGTRVFRDLEKDPSESWSLVRYHAYLWASVSKFFCNYSLRNILLSRKSFL